MTSDVQYDDMTTFTSNVFGVGMASTWLTSQLIKISYQKYFLIVT